MKIPLMITFFAFFLSKSHGMPQLTSNITSFYNDICFTTVVFICNALEYDQEFLRFYFNTTMVLSYFYNHEDSFPRNISSSDSFELSVQISSAELITNRSALFNFVDFALSINIKNFPELVGTRVSCGSELQRSNIIQIGSSPLTENQPSTSLDVSYTAYYTGNNVELSIVSLQWMDKAYQCNLSILYTVQFIVEDAIIFNTTINSRDCVNNVCTWRTHNNHTFLNNQYISCKLSVYRTFTVLHWSTQVSTKTLLTSAKSLLFGNASTYYDKCQPSLMCPSFSVNDCIITYGYNSRYCGIKNTITLSPNSNYTWTRNASNQNPIYVELETFVNMTTLFLQYDFTDSCENSFMLVRSAFIIIALVLTGVTVLGTVCAAIIIGIRKKATNTISLSNNNEQQSPITGEEDKNMKMTINEVYSIHFKPLQTYFSDADQQNSAYENIF